MASRASSALSASPTTVMPPAAVSRAVRRARAGASSSTSRARSHAVASAAVAGRCSGDTNGISIRAMVTPRDWSRVSVKRAASAKCPRSRSRTLRRPNCSPARRAKAARSGDSCRPGAVVGHVDREALAGERGRHIEPAVPAHLGDAVLHGVLDQRVHEHRRHVRAAGAGVGLDGVAQAGAEARFFDVEIGGRKRQFLIERRPFAVGAAQGVAEHLGELLDGAVGAGGIAVDERGHGVERVEEEVRIDLRAQGLQFRLARLHAQPPGPAGPAPGVAAAGARSRPDT